MVYEDGSDLNWLLARLAWSLLPIDHLKVRIWGANEPSEFVLPGEFDQTIPIEQFLQTIEWKVGAPRRLAPGQLRITSSDGGVIRDAVVWKGDSSREGSEFGQLAHFIRSPEIGEIRRQSQQRFADRSRSWQGAFEQATVLATGPSFDHYEQLDTGRDFVVTCNSAVINREMMDKLQPQAVVFADPIFHFGPSLYAGEFRRELKEAAARNDFTIFIPEIYAFLYLASLPELAERTVFVPISTERSQFNLDLCREWETRVTKNILTFLMFPLAATFARTIRILGCDGRALSENQYFWGHSKSAQLNDRMTNIQKVHPGFFAIDYNDYYLDHCRSLEQLLSQAEAAGRRVHSVAPSKIPALATRAITKALSDLVDVDTEVALQQGGDESIKEASIPAKIGFVSVNPSLRSRMGHAIHQDISMKAEVERGGSGFVTLAHHELIEELRGGFALPTFRVMSVEVARAKGTRQAELASRFVGQWFRGLEVLEESSDISEATIFLYLGHSALLSPVASRLATGRFPCRKVVVNLFSGYFDSVGRVSHPADLIDAALRVKAVSDVERLTVVCDSEPLRDAIWKVSGIVLPSLPMAPSQDIRDESGADLKPEGPLRVVFPSHAEKVRGFKVLQKFARRKASSFVGSFDFTFRQFAPWDPGMAQLPPAQQNVQWLGGELGNEEYSDLMSTADVILLPYCSRAFHYRTSSILTEAFSLGKPVIAVEGTWLSDQVRKTGAGWVMEDLSVGALVDVLKEISRTGSEVIRGREYPGASNWLGDNSIENFVEAVIESEQHVNEIDPGRLLPVLDEFRRRSGFIPMVRGKKNEVSGKMRKQLKELLPESAKNTLRPWVNRYRRFRSSGKSAFGSKSKGNSTLTVAELDTGFSRAKKARLDEGELIRSYFSSQSENQDRKPLCIDVGAHYGTSARPLLEDGWKVIGFEPDEKNREKLQSGLKKYIPDSLVIESLAVSDEVAEEVGFYRSEVSTGISGLSSFHESHSSAGSVSTTTLEVYSEGQGIDAVDFLKIDTEGFDFHVLRGIPWEKWKPGAVLCEFEDRKTIPLGYTWKEMADFLVQHGYEIWVSEWHPIIEYGQAHDWNRIFCYPGELADSGSWGNLLAFQKPIDPSTMIEMVGDHLQIFGK